MKRHGSAALAPAGLALVGLVLAGCGGPTAAGSGARTSAAASGTTTSSMAMDTTMATSSATASSTAMATGTGAPAGTTAVSIAGFAFSPATLTVPVGTTVSWTNRDEDPHTVAARDKSFSSPTLETGQTYRHTFTQAGSYAYLCTIHPFMTATVVVTP